MNVIIGGNALVQYPVMVQEHANRISHSLLILSELHTYRLAFVLAVVYI